MLDVAHRYAAGASSVHELSGAINSAQKWAKASGANGAVMGMLEEWSVMINRRWNEWGSEELPISEHEFQAWLQTQLVGKS